jgi:hypothetical protein
VLTDDELQALRDIERRLRWHSPQLVQLFNSVEPQSETTHHERGRTKVLLAAAALTGLTLLGPRMLNETEIRTQRRAAAAHRGSRQRHRPPDRPGFGSRRPGRPGRSRRHLPLPRPINHVRDAACRAT